MKITFEQAYEVLDKCSAVIWDDINLSYPCLVEDKENDAVFLILECDVYDARMQFVKGDNLEVMVAGSSLWLKNTHGEDIQVSVLYPKNVVDCI